MGTAPAGGDRLSNLPDCLLHNVLSCLRSRQVVHTSLLSRRWRHLWRAVPCVDIHHRDFLDDEPEPEPGAYHRADGAFDAAMYDAYRQAQNKRMGREIMQRRDFEDFADSVLPLNVAWPLDAYRLHLGGDVHLHRSMGRWIRRGLARRPAELRVACDYDHAAGGHHRSHKDPFFSFGIFSRSRTEAVTSRLRRLSLTGLILFESFEEELRSRCPVLEDLQLVNCECHRQSWDGLNRICIASRSLKRLVIEGSSSEARLCLNAPALVSLNVGMPVAVEEEMPSLAVASILCHAGVLGLLKSLRSARTLELRWFTTWALVGEEPDLFNEFHNLRTLVLTECEIGDGCQVLAHVLKSVLNLERIVLQDCMISGSCMRASRRGAPLHGCCQNLKSIQVKYEGHDVAHLPVAALRGGSKECGQVAPRRPKTKQSH